MGCHIVCHKCPDPSVTGQDRGELLSPTLREAITRVYDCPKCGHDHSNHIDTDDIMLMLLERIEHLEEKVKRRTGRVINNIV